MNNKTRLFILPFFLLIALSCSVASNTPDKLTLFFFGSLTCGECAEIKQDLLKPLHIKYADKLLIETHNIEDKKSFALMIALEKKYKVTEPSPQELFFPDTVLLGYEAIMASAEQLVAYYVAHPETWQTIRPSTDTANNTTFHEDLKARVNAFTFWGVFAAGIVDGVNPCAIATMIFLISFLATQKKKRIEVLIIGLTFTTAVFFTYLLLGLGAFRLLTLLDQYRWVSEVVRWFAVAVAGIIALLSFKDALSYKKTGKTSTITLQLPKALKLKIHTIISGNLSGGQLISGALATGFLVTLLEAVCTGQVYLPTIVLMTKSSGFQLKGWAYLVFYNLLFVLPLLIVMALAYFGLKWNDLAKTTQKHLTVLKILLGLVLVGLAIFLAVAG